MKNSGAKKIGDILLSLIVMLFFISLAVILTLNAKWLYYMDIDLLNIPETSGLSKEVIKENYDVLIDYNNIFGPDKLVFPSLAMSETGEIHFEEVKDIFVGFCYFFIASAVLSILGIIIKLRKKDYFFLKLSSIFTVVIPLILGVLIALNWQWFFIKFHEIAFDNNYWIFDAATDPVITILPDEFFMHCAIMILSIVILLSITSFVLYKFLTKRK